MGNWIKKITFTCDYCDFPIRRGLLVYIYEEDPFGNAISEFQVMHKVCADEYAGKHRHKRYRIKGMPIDKGDKVPVRKGRRLEKEIGAKHSKFGKRP
jgi:hypothetical protein